MLVVDYYKQLDIPRSVWKLQIGAVLNAFGTGSTVPFLMLYLHNGRGFDLALSGVLVGTIALAGLASAPFVGSVIDRVGPKRSLVAALAVLVVAFLGFIVVREPWQAALCAVLAGLGNAWLWPSNGLMMARMLGPERRHMAFAIERSAANLGLGLGAFLGGVLIATLGYLWLFVVDAASFALYLVLVLRFGREPSPEPMATSPGEPASKTTLLSLLRSRPLRRTAVLKFAFVLAGFGPFEVLAVFARDQVGVNTALVGVIFLANTVVIVACQIPLAGMLPGRSRMRVLALVATLWASAWVVAGVTDLTLTGVGAGVVLVIVAALFGLGESLQVPAQDPLFIELAPPDAHGRSMALSAITFQAAMALGTAGAGWLLSRAPDALWPVAAVLALASGGLALLSEAALPSSARTTKSGS
ncbi:MFS transporter [Streptomyces sp. NPDC057555]|uniref:Major facilitator superfamily protein n=1 Tax=Streptomyces sp. JCM 9888 TaxID=1570103 RepID=A0A0B5GQA8_9ACTN|nr:Major facilitator superfamily protein [Streptomyces sp. JCM 9888]